MPRSFGYQFPEHARIVLTPPYSAAAAVRPPSLATSITVDKALQSNYSKSIRRWGNWLKAVLFYAENFEAIKEVVEQFDSSEAIAINSSQLAFENPSIKQNIALIATHFSNIPDAIERLETKNLSLCKSLEILEKIIEHSNALPNSLSEKVRGKLNAALYKNPCLEGIKKVNAFINGTGQILPEEVSAEMAPNFKFCPVTSVDVERSFSAYKLVLTNV
nr:unnamed protein product [Callosobruchus analis]